MKLSIPASNIKQIQQLLNTFSPNNESELEFRLGTFSDNFKPSISSTNYQTLLSHFDTHKDYTKSITEQETQVYDNGVRFENDVYIKKQKLKTVDIQNIEGVALRLSLSSEIKIDPPDSLPTPTIRHKIRSSFKHKNGVFRIDLTNIENQQTYEVEVEYLKKLDVKALFEPIKIILGLITSKKYIITNEEKLQV